MFFKVEIQPVSEPLTLEEVKNYLKLESGTVDDALINGLIEAARQKVENHCDMGLLPQTVSKTFDAFPVGGQVLRLNGHPFVAISSITYTDENGDSQTLSTDVYTHAGEGVETRVGLKTGQSWPSTASQIGAVKVTYTLGYADVASVPQAIKAAMLLIVAHWYEKREDSVRKLPTQSEWLLEQYQLIKIK